MMKGYEMHDSVKENLKMLLLKDAEKIGFMFAKGGFPKVPPSDFDLDECEAFRKGWDSAKTRSLEKIPQDRVHSLIDAAFLSGNIDVLAALDNFVEVALVNKLG